MKKSLTLLILLIGAMAQLQARTIADPDNPSQELTNDRYPPIVERYIAKADYEKAHQYIELGLKKNPLSIHLRFLRCIAFESEGNDVAAREAYEAFIKTYPEVPEAYNNLAVLYAKIGQLDRAEELVKRALMLRPNFALAHENLANLYLTRASISLKAAQSSGSSSAAERLEALEKVPR